MLVKLNVPGLKCSREIAPHLEKVLECEYDMLMNYGYPPAILDLGANVAAFSIWASHRWPGAIIHAYEPHPENIKLYEENLEGYPNIHLHKVGVGKPGLRPLFNGKNNEGEHSFLKVMNNPCATGQHIEVIDPLTLPEADILKMDIE